MILHIKPPEGTTVEVGEKGDVVFRLPKPSTYEDASQIIGLFDIHTHATGDRIDLDGLNCTLPYDRATVGVNRKGRVRISR